jgi:hypothetical protein
MLKNAFQLRQIKLWTQNAGEKCMSFELQILSVFRCRAMWKRKERKTVSPTCSYYLFRTISNGGTRGASRGHDPPITVKIL